MSEDTSLLAYCGVYCGDCLGYRGELAGAAQALVEILDRHQFERTAECVFPQELAGCGRLREMLGFMAGLRCEAICRRPPAQGGPTGCAVRACCLRQGFFACYECDGFETCETLRSLHGGLHAGAAIRNLRAIRQMGLEAWLGRGERHTYWTIDEDG